MALGRTVAACWHPGPSRCCPARSGTGLCRTAPTLQHSSRSRAVCSYKADSGAQEEPQQPAQPRLPQLPQPQLVEGKDLQLLELKFERRQDQVVNAVDAVRKDVNALQAEVKKDVNALQASVAEVKKDVAEVKKDVAEVKRSVAEVRLLLISFAVLVVAIFGYKELLPLLKVI